MRCKTKDWPVNEFGQFGVFRQDIHAFLFESSAKRAIEYSRVAEAGLERLGLDPLVTDHLHLNFVALLVEPKMFEPEQHSHPCGTADACDRELLAAQIFRPFDVRPGHQIVGIAAGEAREKLEIMACCDRRKHRAAAGTADLQIARRQARNQGRGAANQDRLCIDAVLGKNALVGSDPKRHQARRDCGVTDATLVALNAG